MNTRTHLLAVFVGAMTLGCVPQAPPPESPHPELAASFTVAAYGDSLTRGPAGESWTTQMPAVWGRIGRGVLGETATVGAQRLAADLDSGLLTSVEDVEVLVLLWGTNDVGGIGWLDLPEGVTVADYYADQVANHGLDPDLAAGYAEGSTSPTDLRDRVFAAIARARALGIDVVLATPPPRADATTLNPQLESLGVVLCNAAAQAGVPCIDLYQAFAGHEGGAASLLDTDGIHLGPDGRLLVAELVAPVIQPLYEAWTPPAP